MRKNENLLIGGMFSLLLILIAATIILASVPPVDRDALTHHLFVPKLWLKHGGIYEIPEVPFSYYPMNLDVLYTLALYWGSDILPKYIHLGFALLTGLLLYRYLNARLGKNYALYGVLFFLSVPIIVKLSITVYVDLGLAFFTTASLLLLLDWADRHFPWQRLLLSGLCCGLAAGTKYNGIVSIVVLTLLVPLLYQQSALPQNRSNFKASLCAVVFLLASLASFSPWLIKNYVWTGNPIYPLHNKLFQKTSPPDNEQSRQIRKDFSESLREKLASHSNTALSGRKVLYNETWWEALLLPIRFFIEGKDDDPRYFDGKLSPFLLLLPMLAFLFRPKAPCQRREQNFLLWFTLLSFFFTFFQEAMRIRYVVPIVPPLVILSLYGIRGLRSGIRQKCSPIAAVKWMPDLPLALLLCAALGYNGQYIIHQFKVVQPLPYLSGTQSRDQYISTYRREYPAIQRANTLLPANAKVLCIFLGNRGYYMDFQPVFEQPYSSASILAQYLASSSSSQHTIIDELHQRQITHVLFRTDLTAQWLHQLSEDKRQRIAPLFTQTDRPLWSGSDHVLLTLEQQNR
nr:glycosyltransferase family 39 protein [uncultured Desulfobulbus sp.]